MRSDKPGHRHPTSSYRVQASYLLSNSLFHHLQLLVAQSFNCHCCAMAALNAKPPKGDVRELGIQSYTRARRPALGDTINFPFREKDDEIRRLARVEFKTLAADEQWHWVQNQEATFLGHDVTGKFESNTSPTNLSVGVKVSLHSLIGRSDLNGQTGVCNKYVEETDRWEVRVTNGELANVRAVNLHRMVVEPAGTKWFPLPWSECTRATARQHTFRQAIDDAAGGETPSPLEVSLALSKTLTREEQDACIQRFQADAETKQAVAGRKLIEVILNNAKSFVVPVLMLCLALRQLGWTSHYKIKTELKLQIPLRTWNRSANGEVGSAKSKHDNGRPPET
jgi:hypothetical protein